MKKVRLNLKRGVRNWSFLLYDSPESAFFLRSEPFDEKEDPEYRRRVTLKAGEVMEVEWLGSEWAYDTDLDTAVREGDISSTRFFDKFDKIRLGKIVPLKDIQTSRKSGYIEIYSGWVSGRTIPWSEEDIEQGVRITSLNDSKKHKLDFSKLFKNHLPEDDEDELDIPKQMPSSLN